MFRVLLIGLAAASLLTCATGPGRETYEVATVTWPHGDPVAGREAFVELGCTSCHAVSWESELPAPVAAVDAPALGRALATQPMGSVATSIVLPSHWVTPQVRHTDEDGLSPMGDFTRAMTVRQLIDVVAYVRSGGGDAVADAAPPESSRIPPM
ncbi:MAG: c-type cytochrome [Candidatus Eiseniibacteriota bacterium]|jgi:hypothetical protein